MIILIPEILHGGYMLLNLTFYRLFLFHIVTSHYYCINVI